MIGVYARNLETFDLGDHVFPGEKYRKLARILETRKWFLLPAKEPASFKDLGIVHTAAYLKDPRHLRWTPRTLSSEFPMNREIVDGFRNMATRTLLASKKRGKGRIRGGFHHAYADHTEGFCYVNACLYDPETPGGGADPPGWSGGCGRPPG